MNLQIHFSQLPQLFIIIIECFTRISVLLILHAPHSNNARIYKPCELAQELLQLGVPLEEVPTWVCIARYESKYNTSAIGHLNGNWSNDWGIFQVSDRYWCISAPQRKSQNLCQMNCHMLITDDLRSALQCAQIVRKRQGWQAWAVYNSFCRHRYIENELIECKV